MGVPVLMSMCMGVRVLVMLRFMGVYTLNIKGLYRVVFHSTSPFIFSNIVPYTTAKVNFSPPKAKIVINSPE